MRLRQKIILFAVAPLVLALSAISLTVYHQATSLVQQERAVIKPAYLATKESELKNYVALATQAISHLYESGKTDAATKDAARAILAKLEYSEDGYFFLFDLKGTMLMHPRLKESVGKNMWNLADPNGKMIIQDLIHIARAGGGFYDYVWPKPSANSNDPKPKRSYAIELPAWGWMLGTGVYLDDIDDALAEVDQKASNNITNTMLWILAIMLLSLLMVILVGLALNIWDQRDTLEKERMRFAGELHDGVCQKLGAIKLHIEALIKKLAGPPQDMSITLDILEETTGRLYEVNDEVRGIARGLYPEILTDLGLESALRQLTHDYLTTPIDFFSTGDVNGLSDPANLALYRMAQESFENTRKYAVANRIMLRLEGDERYVTLAIIDDGIGFDVSKCTSDSSRGMGLRNMRRRLEDEGVDGKLTLRSSPQGTTVMARVPRKPRNTFLINLFPCKRK
ncbi:cache domain-containing protein [Nitrosospira sp. Nsp1]|uniref:cache domain-containing protein n=1 Tax=Nitrosospira sp. Nsp1 TaxID=136547 RepID=UPI0008842947|nr:cache domain-containing protein [Nitrosospira sp. Nsp1]SCX46180.1 signal transduction histidine kinase [Nitrosospira sp. Nsp1]